MLGKLIDRIEDVYSEFVVDGNHEDAMKDLRLQKGDVSR